MLGDLKPVAWMYQDNDEVQPYVHVQADRAPKGAYPYWTETPLYTAEQMAADRIEGAKAMQEAVCNGLTAHAKRYNEASREAQIAKKKVEARDYQTMSMAIAFRQTEIAALSPEAIAKERFND